MSRQKDFQVVKLDIGSSEAVCISHIIDPDNFFVQLERTSDSLDEIMNLMQTYYKESGGPSEKLPSLVLGAPCAALYTDGECYRAKITGLLTNGMVEVLFVDYGNTDFVSKDNIFALRPDLYATPVQSFRCRLEGVGATQEFWSPQHIAQFEDSVLEKSFTATLSSFNPEMDCYAVQLVDESGVSINKKFGNLTGSIVVEPSASARNVSVRGEDLHINVQQNPSSQPKARGIAHALGVSVGEVSPVSNISAIPPVSLKVGEKMECTVVYVATPSEFWCQVKKFSELSDRTLDDMAKVYGSMGPGEGLLPNLRPGCVCAALFSEDETWYRATVEKVTGREVTVYFLDYGNIATVSAGNIRELREQFRSMPAQAVKCSLNGVTSASDKWTDDVAIAFEEMVLGKEYVITVVSKEPSGSHRVSMLDPVENADVASALINNQPAAVKGGTKATVAAQSPAAGPSLPSFNSLPVRTPSKLQVYLSWVTTPGEFYVQIANNQSILDTLTEGLQHFYNSPRAAPVSSVQTGMMVVAKFSEDDAWYRGVVRGLSSNTAEVEFVDFGNFDKIQIDSLRQMDKQFSNIPAQAIPCSLAGVRPLSQGQTWSGDAKDFLERLTENGATCQFAVNKRGVYEVELEVDGKSIAKEMIAHAVVRGISEPPSDGGSRFEQYQFEKIRPGQRAKVYVAFADSVSSFFVQRSARMQELDDLMAQLEAHYNSGSSKSLGSPQVGMPCVARYEEDGLWYRAQVRSFTTKDIDVFFVDYGNTQVAPKDTVYKMESSFMSFAAQAIQCSLDIREGRNAEAQLKQFTEVTGDEELEVTVKSQDGSKLVVDLMKQGTSITGLIKGGSPAQSLDKLPGGGGYTPAVFQPGQTIQAFASYIESSSKFWIQLAGSDDDLNVMLKTLRQHYQSGAQPALANPAPGQACCALYAEDQSWYRASVVSIHGQQIKVQFVDYGNAELVDRETIKPISPEFLTKPLMAVECCLDGFQSAPATDEAAEAAETLLAEKDLTVTFTGGKNVTVTIDGVDAGKVLIEKGFGSRQQRNISSPKSPQPGFGSRSPQPLQGGGGFGARSPQKLVPQNFNDPAPPSGSSDAIITHLEETSGLFFIQLLSAEAQLEQLSSKLQSIFSSGGSALPAAPSKDMICCARYSADGCWYRSTVESVTGSRVTVRFVDYGNSETVQANSLKSVPADLMSAPVQAFPCRLKGLQSWTKQIAGSFSKAALDVQIKVRFVSSSSPFEVQISVSGQDLLQLLSKSPASSPQKPFSGAPKHHQQGPPPRSARQEDWDDDSLAPQSFDQTLKQSGGSSTTSQMSWPHQVFQRQKSVSGKEDVYISHVSEDGTFYLQLSQDSEKIEAITEKLESLSDAVHPNPIVGAACAAKFSADEAWYRAIIKSTSGTSVNVTFVDFGNGEKCAASSLQPLPSDLLIPAYAYHCQLEETGPFGQEQLEMFKAATVDKQFKATFTAGDPICVTLAEENGKNLTEVLFPCGSLQPQTVPKETVPAIVSHIGEKGRFFVQLNKDEIDLLSMGEKMETSYPGQAEKPDSFEEGQVCCAKFPEDDAWYRAVILKDCGDSVHVLFVDYGNSEAVDKTNVLELLSCLTRPAFAYECQLQGVTSWTSDQKKKFKAMTDNKTMNVRFLSSKPPYDVELTRSIGLDLLEESTSQNTTAAGSVNEEKEAPKPSLADSSQVCEEVSSESVKTFPAQTPPPTGSCIVSHVDTQGQFFLQLTSEDEAREILSERLQAECQSPAVKSVIPAVTMACCAKYSEDGAWYRAVVEKIEGEMITVRFIDFGNTDLVPVTDLREVQGESLLLSPLAYWCILEGCASVKTEVSEKLEEVTAEQTLAVTFTLPTQQPPYSVQLQLEDGSSVAALFGNDEGITKTQADQTQKDNDYKVADSTPSVSSIDAEDDRTQISSENLVTMNEKSESLSVGHRQKVTVCQVISPSLFYVHVENQACQFDEQTDAMFEHYSSLAEGDGLAGNLVHGQLCASQYGEDESWYRACVQRVEADGNTCTLFYIDYGNTDVVASSSVRQLLPEFESLPWQAVACSLAGVRCQGDDWSKEVKAAFEELIADKSLLADVLQGGDSKGSPYTVHLLDMGISVATSLLDQALPGIEAVDVETSVKHMFSDTRLEDSLLSDVEEKFEDTVQDVLQNGQEAGQSGKGTVDELEDNENEQEFSRQLNQRDTQLESTMLDEPTTGMGDKGQEDVPCVSENGTKAEEDEEDFQDAVEADTDRTHSEQLEDDHQAKFSCIADGIAELEWIVIRICYAESPAEFWCQLPSAEEDLSSIKLDNDNTADQESAQSLQVGHTYLVSDPPHKAFRAKVLTVDEELEKISILKVDLGMVENVDRKSLFHLTKEQQSLPFQAFCCCLDDCVQSKQAWLLDLIDQANICDTQIQLKVVGRKADGTLLVDLREPAVNDDSESLQLSKDVEESDEGEKEEDPNEKTAEDMSMDQMLEISQPVLQSTVLGETMCQLKMDKSEGEKDYSAQQLEAGKEYEVQVTAGGVPGAFYLMLASSHGVQEALADDIAAEVAEKLENQVPLDSAVVGTPCLALDTTSSTWLRGRIKAVTEEGYTVLCVDTGSLIEVSRDGVRELPNRFLDPPAQCVLCCLADLEPADGEWCDSALTYFADFVSQASLRAYISSFSADSSVCHVTLLEQATANDDTTVSRPGSEPSLNRNLVELGYAEAVPGSALDVQLQLERTINDPEKLEQLESSFTEISCQRENSFGDESENEEAEAEQASEDGSH